MNPLVERALPSDFRRFDRSEVETSISERFAKIAARHASRVAIADGEVAVTYAELDRESNRVAHTLLEKLGRAPEPLALQIGRAHV